MAIRRLLFLRRSTPLLSRLPAKPVKLLCSSAPHRDYREVHSSAGPLRFGASDFSRAPVNAAVEYACEETVEECRGGGDASDRLEIANLGISRVIVNALAKREITKLFPIQGAVLEPAMQGRDMIGRARTGTGKTLAFGIPIMDKIIQFNAKHGRGRNPLALVMAPTRELARQVEKEFRESSDLDTICVYGGTPIYQQMRTLDCGVDVVVGTPGRIIDLLKRGALNLSEVQFVVLDEADQMLAVGFAEDVEIILEKLPKQRQSMMFSATMPNWITQLTRKYLKDPLTVDLVGDSDKKLAEGITLYSIVSDNYGKPSVVAPLIAEYGKGGKCIVFTQTKRDADRLAYFLGKNLRCEALHGDITQAKREKTLSNFRDGQFNVLVATDVAARGLDVPNVDLVIHYELPNSSEIFVHRSGRTGRAGKKGSAILIHTEQQAREVRMIEQHVGCRFKELPKIAVEGGAGLSMFGDTGSHWGSTDRPRGGGSTFGNSNSYGGAGFGRRGGPSGYGGMGSNRSNFLGTTNSHPSSGFGHSGFNSSGGNSNHGFGRPNNFGSSGSGPSGHNNLFGGPNSSHNNGFPNSGSSFRGGSGTFNFSDWGSKGSGPHVDSNSSSAGSPKPSNFGFGGSGDHQSGNTF